MNKTLVNVIGIIALVTFIIGMACAVLGIVGGTWFMNASDDMYIENKDTPGANQLFGLLTMLGGGALGIAGLIAGICVAIYDTVAHIPALIAYIVGKKSANKTIYWLLISLWLCLLFGTSFFIIVF